MLRITNGKNGLYTVSHWDVDKIYNLNAHEKWKQPYEM